MRENGAIKMLPSWPSMSVDSGGQGGMLPSLDFQTWYKYSRKRLKSVIFCPFFAIFWSFFPLPPSPEEAK